MRKTCGLVCEGKSDFIVLEHMIHDHFAQRGVEISFRRLQPHSDATGKIGEGGWRQVFQWCLRNAKPQRDALFAEEAIFSISESQRIDFLVIQMDADVCQTLKDSDLESIEPFRNDPIETAEERAAFIRSCLGRWLDLDLNDAARQAHVLAVPVEAAEAWLIADVAGENVETLRDLMSVACSIIYERLNIRLPSDGRTIKKKPSVYARYLTAHAPSSEKAHQHCLSFRRLVEEANAAMALT